MPHATIDRQHFNALLKCLGGDDSRFYLAGIHIDLARRIAESTNGHRLLRVPLAVDVADPTLENGATLIYLDNGNPLTLNPEHAWQATKVKPFPKKSGDTLWLTWLDAERLVISDSPGYEPGARSALVTRIDCKYPDTDSVLETNGSVAELGPKIAFNPAYLTDVSTALGSNIVYFERLKDAGSPFSVTFHPAQRDVTYIIMPCRV